MKKKIQEFDGVVLFTRETHESNYLQIQEGRNLPVPHCIRGTEGWQIRKELHENALKAMEVCQVQIV